MTISIYSCEDPDHIDFENDHQIFGAGVGGWCDIKLTIACAMGYFKRSPKHPTFGHEYARDSIKLREKAKNDKKLPKGLRVLFSSYDTHIKWDPKTAEKVSDAMVKVIRKYRKTLEQHTTCWQPESAHIPSTFSFFIKIALDIGMGKSVASD